MTVILRPPGSIYLSWIIRITDYIIMILISCLLRPCQRFLYLRTCRFGDAMVIGIGGDTRRDADYRWSSGVHCNTYYYVIYMASPDKTSPCTCSSRQKDTDLQKHNSLSVYTRRHILVSSMRIFW